MHESSFGERLAKNEFFMVALIRMTLKNGMKQKKASIIRDVCMWVSQIEPFFNEKNAKCGFRVVGQS